MPRSHSRNATVTDPGLLETLAVNVNYDVATIPCSTLSRLASVSPLYVRQTACLYGNTLAARKGLDHLLSYERQLKTDGHPRREHQDNHAPSQVPELPFNAHF